MTKTQELQNSGVLYVVATPIGHLDDISIRALQILRQVHCIAAEDTRHSKRLLDHYQIATPMLSVHEHNEATRVPQILERLKNGEQFALVSDAGTPLLSDPGFLLVRAAREAHLRVIPIPGPSALIAALSAAGMAVNQFIFLGFLPHQSEARLKLLAKYDAVQCTLVAYESPHRILSTLKDLEQLLSPDREICLARELTKTYETFLHGTVADIRQLVEADVNQQKGEIVLIIEGHGRVQEMLPGQVDRLLQILLEQMPPSQAAKVVAKYSGLTKQIIYQRALALSKIGTGTAEDS